jgi:hypothetical protein
MHTDLVMSENFITCISLYVSENAKIMSVLNYGVEAMAQAIRFPF